MWSVHGRYVIGTWSVRSRYVVGTGSYTEERIQRVHMRRMSVVNRFVAYPYPLSKEPINLKNASWTATSSESYRTTTNSTVVQVTLSKFYFTPNEILAIGLASHPPWLTCLTLFLEWDESWSSGASSMAVSVMSLPEAEIGGKRVQQKQNSHCNINSSSNSIINVSRTQRHRCGHSNNNNNSNKYQQYQQQRQVLCTI